MDGSADNAYGVLESRIGYQFKHVEQLESALTHKSYLNENPTWARSDNERLEFLGDAVLDLVVSHLLMEAQPDHSEGDLSKTRAAIVSEAGLAEVAAELGLGQWLFLGRGEEQSGGRHKPSVLADACEALIAAVYLDGGFAAAFSTVRQLFYSRVLKAEEAGQQDYKTRLQEQATKRRLSVRYAVVAETGPDHHKVFEVAVTVGDRELGRAEGRSKKEAEQGAAEAALRQLHADLG